MKIAKTVGCLALLCAIICGCVLMAGRDPDTPSGDDATQVDATVPPVSSPPEEETELTGSVPIEKVYSEGLKFRSNGDGTCALAGLGSCTSSCILVPPQSPTGDTVTEILPYAFADSIIGAIELPETIKTLSASSFTGCRRLAYIRVSSANTAFCELDGVLYTKDGTTLVYCPAGRSGSSLALAESLKRIAAGAFAECTTLQSVTFNGSTSEWHNVVVGDENEPLYAATFRFLT